MAKNKHPVPAFLNTLGMEKIKTSDEFIIAYKDGMLEATVKRKTGKVESIRQTIKGQGFSQMTNFDPTEMTDKERNMLIKKKYKNGKGDSQTEIGRIFGLKQPQISRILNT